MRNFIPLVIVLLAPSAYAADPVAARVHKVFEAKCFRCHGEPGQPVKGGFDFVLDFAKLRRSDKLDLPRPDKSLIYELVRDGEMPYRAADLPANEVTDVLEWIQTGAPDAPNTPPPANRPFVSEADALEAIARDLRAAPRERRAGYRYVTLTHLHNGPLPEADIEAHRDALAKTLNSLSWEPKVVTPTEVGRGVPILRFDLAELGWTADTWEILLRVYPYAVVVDSSTAAEVYAATSTRMPFIRADWLVANATIPPLYHLLLNLPKTDRELEKLVGVDVPGGIASLKAQRAGFRGGDFPDGSGVSRNNRVIERHASPYGAYWKSYDFARNSGTANIFENPLGPGGGPLGFTQAGGEIIFNLPNGFQAYLLVDSAGHRIDFGPSDIVQDPARRDKRVINGASCMNCHQGGMREKFDQLASLARQGGRFEAPALRRIESLYAPESAMRSVFREDAERFRKAMARAGVTMGSIGDIEPVFLASEHFAQPLTLDEAAFEYGLAPAELGRRLDADPTQRSTAAALRGAGLPRDQFGEAFPRQVRTLGLGQAFTGGADPDRIEGDVTAALFDAAKSGDARRTDLAITKGANLERRDDDGRGPLHYAAEGGFTQVIARLLREPRLPVAATDARDARQALDLAAVGGHLEAASLLLDDWRSNLITRDAHGHTPLILATLSGSAPLVRRMLGHPHTFVILNQADPEEGFTALHWAATRGAADVIDELLKTTGIESTVRDSAGRTPLQLTLERQRATGLPVYERIAQALRARGGG